MAPLGRVFYWLRISSVCNSQDLGFERLRIELVPRGAGMVHYNLYCHRVSCSGQSRLMKHRQRTTVPRHCDDSSIRQVAYVDWGDQALGCCTTEGGTSSRAVSHFLA
jgi:hypothetical protein